ncbi:MAG: CoA-binding protein [Spirochaetes bacterium]|nr:CoA-binding protein [Spirochaetota bacterium]
MTPASKASLDGFYAAKRLAIIGVSRKGGDYSRMLFSALRKKGYDVVPVNPAVGEVDGVACKASIKEVAPAVEGVIVLLPAGKIDGAVRECAESGVKRVWVHSALKKNLAALEAPGICAGKGIDYISGTCPFMFLPGTPFPHSLHGGLVKAFGGAPK